MDASDYTRYFCGFPLEITVKNEDICLQIETTEIANVKKKKKSPAPSWTLEIATSSVF